MFKNKLSRVSESFLKITKVERKHTLLPMGLPWHIGSQAVSEEEESV